MTVVTVGPDQAGAVTVYTTTPRPAADLLPAHYDPIPLKSATPARSSRCAAGALARRGMSIYLGPEMGYVWPMFRTEDLDSQGSVGHGDSGGPVFSLTNSGTRAGAMGIISAIDTTAPNIKPCRGVTSADFPTRACSRIAYHVNLLRVNIDLGLRLRTV
jgi:hypothetical protein